VSRLAAIRRGRSVRANISGGRGRPWGIFFGFYKARDILLSESDRANCTVLRAVVLTQYRRVTDGHTDGIAVASTALAKRPAVIKEHAGKICMQLNSSTPTPRTCAYQSAFGYSRFPYGTYHCIIKESEKGGA